MDTSIEFEFSLTSQDYGKATRLFYLHQRSMWIMVLLTELIGVLGLVGISVFGKYMEDSLFVGMLAVFLVWLVIGFPLLIILYLPYQVKRRMAKKESPLQRWRVTERGIEVRTEHSESKVDWEVLGRVVESKEYCLLSWAASKRMFIVVPKRAFRGWQEEKRFRELVMRKVDGM